jgi:hypothetical protein
MSHEIDVAGRRIAINHADPVLYAHVVKHLYAKRQRWDLAIPGLPFDPRARSRAAGCAVRDLSHGWSWPQVGEPCRAHVLRDHHRHYLPAAVDAVRTAVSSGHHAVVETRQGQREILVEANAVQVLLTPMSEGEPQDFVTALRDPPSTRDPTNADFLRKAVRKLHDKASLGSGETP